MKKKINDFFLKKKKGETFGDALTIAQWYFNPKWCLKFQMTPISDSAQEVGGCRVQSVAARPVAACKRYSFTAC